MFIQTLRPLGRLAPILCSVALLLSGCGGSSNPVGDEAGRVTSPTPSPTPTDFACTASIEPGIRVNVVDAATGLGLTSGVTVTLQDGSYTETQSQLSGFDGNTPTRTAMYQGAYERVGTYTVRVTKDGYAPFERTGIVVTANPCHVNTVDLEARLTPAP